MPGRFLHRRAAVAISESQRLVEESKALLAELLASAETVTTTLAEMDQSDEVLRFDYEGRALALTATISAARQELARLELLAAIPADDLAYDPFPPRSISPDLEERRYDPPA